MTGTHKQHIYPYREYLDTINYKDVYYCESVDKYLQDFQASFFITCIIVQINV